MSACLGSHFLNMEEACDTSIWTPIFREKHKNDRADPFEWLLAPESGFVQTQSLRLVCISKMYHLPKGAVLALVFCNREQQRVSVPFLCCDCQGPRATTQYGCLATSRCPHEMFSLLAPFVPYIYHMSPGTHGVNFFIKILLGNYSCLCEISRRPSHLLILMRNVPYNLRHLSGWSLIGGRL